ncbi:MAG: respiratory nitrate reductase subunit gamma [Candidatus Omnitrophica bacterium]|nr:respiratory nitrate reductase subunit gamma [Candidatus Omnitrophota bacterium]
MSMIHNFLFIALPYVALIVFLIGTVYRYVCASYSVSSMSSQFLESKKLYWGSVPFHIGMMGVFFLHLGAFLIPKAVLAWNGEPLRLIALEITGFVFALSFLFGLIVLFIRRVATPRIRAVTTWVDIAVELLILYQVVLGCIIAANYRWGSSWFASDLSPYLWSILKLDPHIDAVIAMPHVVQAHIVGAFLLILVFPFTRLMHMLVAPFHYLLRPYQQVIWNWDRKTINSAESKWSQHRPRNN